MTLQEISKKRNLSFNIRHRKYGREATMYDGDGILFHYDTEEPVAWLETKYGCHQDIDLNNKEFRCLRNMCRKSQLPLFCMVYYLYDKNDKQLQSDDNLTGVCYHAQYYVIPSNELAMTWLSFPTMMTEEEYVYLEYKLRGYTEEFCRCKAKGFCNNLKKAPLPNISPIL